MHAMVIDDSRATRKILGNMLRDLGFEVSEASHGREALERLAERGEVELALVDWNMPEMNGIDFVAEVRSKPDYDDICLMMVTTETEMERVIKAIEAGANEYVMKPFTKEIIAEKLQMVGLIS